MIRRITRQGTLFVLMIVLGFLHLMISSCLSHAAFHTVSYYSSPAIRLRQGPFFVPPRYNNNNLLQQQQQQQHWAQKKKSPGETNDQENDDEEKRWFKWLRRDKDKEEREKKQQSQTERDKSPGWLGLVLPKKDDDNKDDKDASRKSKQKQKPPKPQSPPDEKEESSGFGLGSIFSVFSGNVTAKTEDDTVRSNRSSASLKNPLSVAQSFFMNAPWPSFTLPSLSLSINNNDNEQWMDVFPKTRIMPGAMVPVTVAGLDLLVIASRDARRLYCMENSCPHLGTPLETGTLVRLPIVEDSATAAAATTTTTGSGSTTTMGSNATTGSGSSQRTKASTTTTSTQLAAPQQITTSFLTETDVSAILQQDGCEDCIVCPLHRTAFALESGQVRGEWCPYPPVLGKLMGNVKPPTPAAVFGVRTRGKMVQVRINTPLARVDDETDKKDKKKKTTDQQPKNKEKKP